MALELLAKTGDIVGQWKEHFRCLPNLQSVYKMSDKYIIIAEVSELIKKNVAGRRVPRAGKIHSGKQKALEIVGLLWLLHLFNVATTPVEWQTGVVVVFFF